MSNGSQSLRGELERMFHDDPRVFRFFDTVAVDGIWFRKLDEPAAEWLSPRFKQLLGYDDDEVAASVAWWQANIHPDDLPGMLAAIEAHEADRHEPWEHCVRFRRKDGSMLWVRCRGVLLRDEDQQPLYALRAHSQVGAPESEAAGLAEQTQALQRANEELEQLAHAIAHDLRAPLRAITGFGEILDKEYATKLGPEGLAFLNHMVTGATRLRGLVDGLIGLLRLEGQSEPLGDVDLNEVLARALVQMRPLVEARGAVVEVGGLPTVRGRETQLLRLFAKLLDNAIKFSEGTPHVDVTGELAGDMLILRVHDEGIGFRERDAERIFKLFQRLHTAEEYPGNGVGLALCKKIAESHGGTITATSAPGQGATFEVRLPRGSS